MKVNYRLMVRASEYTDRMEIHSEHQTLKAARQALDQIPKRKRPEIVDVRPPPPVDTRPRSEIEGKVFLLTPRLKQAGWIVDANNWLVRPLRLLEHPIPVTGQVFVEETGVYCISSSLAEDTDNRYKSKVRHQLDCILKEFEDEDG